MSDLSLAKEHLHGHSICLCKGGEYFTDDGRGISPMMKFIAGGRDLSGYAVADLIVGKAAATLFIKAGITEVYGEVTSEAGKALLDQHGIPCSYGTLTDRIINRAGDGLCPMEQTVRNINDIEEGYEALKNRLAQMRTNI